MKQLSNCRNPIDKNELPYKTKNQTADDIRKIENNPECILKGNLCGKQCCHGDTGNIHAYDIEKSDYGSKFKGIQETAFSCENVYEIFKPYKIDF